MLILASSSKSRKNLLKNSDFKFIQLSSSFDESLVKEKNINDLALKLSFSKAEIIKTGTELDVDYKLTHSCYDPSFDGLSCGECDACILRKEGFTKAGISDPTNYI